MIHKDAGYATDTDYVDSTKRTVLYRSAIGG